MSLALMLAAFRSPSPPPAVPRTQPVFPVDRGMSDSDRLRELDIAVRKAYARGEIDSPTAQEFHVGIARIRRQMVVMGIQVSYRQKLRLRGRIDRVHAAGGSQSGEGGRHPFRKVTV